MFETVVFVQVLSVIPDQDTFYDLVDALEDQGLEKIIQQMMKSRGARADLVDEFRRYEAVVRREDSVVDQSQQQLDLIENAR